MKNEIQIFTQRLKAEINISDYHDCYTIDTAMQAVGIIFQENDNFNRCTPESKYKAVLSMVCQGLNPLKGQCSFVAYGNQLQLLRDYSGSIMVAKREDKRIAAINTKVVREGDIFDFEIVNGCYQIAKHKPTIKSLNGHIIAAYAIAIGHKGEVIDCDVMSYEDIRKTWKNAQLKYKGEPVVRQDGSLHPGSNHAKYPEKMTTKTVVHRLCRSIIKSSGNEQISEVAELDEEYVVTEPAPEANSVPLDFKPEVDAEFIPATRDQAKRIFDLAAEQGFADQILRKQKPLRDEALSEFFKRYIKKISEITTDEAETYILELESGNPTDEKKSGPDWE